MAVWREREIRFITISICHNALSFPVILWLAQSLLAHNRSKFHTEQSLYYDYFSPSVTKWNPFLSFYIQNTKGSNKNSRPFLNAIDVTKSILSFFQQAFIISKKIINKHERPITRTTFLKIHFNDIRLSHFTGKS